MYGMGHIVNQTMNQTVTKCVVKCTPDDWLISQKIKVKGDIFGSHRERSERKLET